MDAGEGTPRRWGADATFVGRASELAALRDDWRAVVGGASRITWIVGEPGMGKTAIARAFVAELDRSSVLWVSADEGEQALHHGVVQHLLGAGGGDLEPAGAGATDLDVGAKLLAALGGRTGPLVVVVDDLQWCDPGSAGALRFVLRRLESDAVFVVLITRPDPAASLGAAWAHFLADPHKVRRCDVAAFDATDVADLVAARCGGHTDPVAARRLWQHTGGHPLYADVLLRELDPDQLSERGVLPAPRSLSQLVAARVGELTDDGRAFVEAGAVLGDAFTEAAAGSIGSLDDPVAALEDVIDAGIVERARSRVRFRHPLVRAAVYNDIPPTRLRALHARGADVTTGVASLVHRAAGATGADDGLADDLDEAAATQHRVGNMVSAADLLLAAAPLTSDPARGEHRILCAVEALVEGGFSPRAQALTPRVEACAWSPHRELVAGLLDARAGRFGAAARHFTLAADGPSSGAAGDVRSRALAGLAYARWFAGDFAAAFDAVDVALRGDVGWGAPLSSYVRVMSLWQLGRADEVGEVGEVQASTAMADVDREAVRGVGCFYRGEMAAAVATLRDVVRRCRDGEPGQLFIVALAMLAEAEFRSGLWDDATIHAELSVSLADASAAVMSLVQAHSVAAEVHAVRGRFEESRGHLDSAERLAAVMPAWAGMTRVATARGSLALARGDHAGLIAAARALSTEPLRTQLEQLPAWRSWVVIVEGHLAAGALHDAARELAVLERIAATHPHPSAAYDVARVRGLLAEAEGRPRDALDSYALQGDAEGDRASLEAGRLALANGTLLCRRRSRRKAIVALRDAHAILRRLDARPYLERCEHEMAACGLEASAADRRRAFSLTPKEESVARLAAAGHSNREVAAQLYVSVKAVEYHLSNAYAKLGIRSRRELAGHLTSPPS